MKHRKLHRQAGRRGVVPVKRLHAAEATMFTEDSQHAYVFPSIENYGADRFAALHQLESFIDAVERQRMRDQIVDVELAFHIPVDDFRHVGAAARAAEGRSFPAAPGDELERPGADFLAGSGHADDDRLPPALVAALQRLPHDGRVADAYEAVVGAAVGELHDGIDDVIDFFRVDEVRHAEFARHRFALRIEIDADDLVGADHARRLDHVQADAAQPEHRDIGAGFDPGRKQHGADK